MNRIQNFTFIAGMLLFALLGASPARGTMIVGAGLQVGTTPGSVQEISGVAASRSLPGNVWVHQDSGDTARFYGLSLPGGVTTSTLHSTITLSGLTATDWEDMTIGPKSGGGNYLYFGDIGDNSNNRILGVSIIRVTEPTAVGNATLTSANYKVKQVRYPDFLPRNAESLFCDPLTSDLYIITKGGTGGGGLIYRLAANLFDTSGTTALQAQGSINAPLSSPTSADISPDGKYILVRNSSGGGTTAYLFERGTGQSVATALTSSPTAVTLHAEAQGEAIGWAPDGSGFYSISEGSNQRIWFYSFTAVPEPSSAALAVTAALGLVAVVAKKRRRDWHWSLRVFHRDEHFVGAP